MALLTFGEGYHNYHHEFQHDYRNGVKPWHWDPTKWTIWLLSKVGLVHDLRRVPDSKILLAEMREAKLRAERHLHSANDCRREERNSIYARCQEMLERLLLNYQKLESAITGKMQLSGKLMQQWQVETRELLRLVKQLENVSA